MASCRQRGNGQWQFTIKVKSVREEPFYFTFDDKEEGEKHCARVEALLRSGVIPPEIAAMLKEQAAPYRVVEDVIRAYCLAVKITAEDEATLGRLIGRVGQTKLSVIDYSWAEQFVLSMKIENNLAPATIRQYVGALARCFDWGGNHNIPGLVNNPLRRLPRGYSCYTQNEEAVLQSQDKKAKVDVSRDRRLEPGEEDRIRLILAGAKPEGKERPLTLHYQPALWLLFTLALETAMRLREIWSLSVQQVDLPRRTVFLEKTKNGDKRQVPLSSVALAAIKEYMELVNAGDPAMKGFAFDQGLLFPWWNGAEGRKALFYVSNKLSQQFHRIFEAAGCENLHFHDLRHEATSRLFERTNLTDARIMTITGHKSHSMVMRYANLRASELADALW